MDSNNHIHVFRDYIVPSTCKENGYILHRCDCGYEHRDNFTPLSGHSFAIVSETAPTCTQNGSRVIRCTVCGEEITEFFAPSGHAWGEWNFQKFPTCTEDGVKMCICSRCGLREEVAAEATGHKLTVMETTKDAVEYFCENCGQTISQPTSRGKRKKFFASHKKSIITTSVSIVLVAALLIATFSFFIPSYNYSVALDSIESGDYAKAYSSLKKCKGFKDSKDLLADFTVYYEEEIYSLESNDSYGTYTTKKYTKVEFCENGNPESMVTTDKNGNIIDRYQYDDKGNIVVFNHYDSEGNMRSRYEYDDKGNTTSEIYYDSEGNVTGEDRYVYKYDESGEILSCFHYNENNVLEYKYEYDEKKDTAIEFYYYSNGAPRYKYEYEYKRNQNDDVTSSVQISYDIGGVGLPGKNVEKIKYNLFGNIKSSTTERYSAGGYLAVTNEIKYELITKDICKYSYYSNGATKSTSTTLYNKDNSVISKEKQKYNEYGYLTLDVDYDSEGNITSQEKYEYINPHFVYTPKSK